MSNPDMHEADFDEGTEVKLKIFNQYLNQWIPVFPKSRARQIQVCDYFSGPGHDASGTLGSPMIALNVVKGHRGTLGTAGTRVILRFNDIDQNKASTLGQVLKAEIDANALGGLVDLQITSQDFSQIFDQEANAIERNSIPSFIFIDQYGIKYVTEAVFSRLCRLQRTDFMFFISSSHIKRFCQQDEFLKYHPKISRNVMMECKNDHIHREICKYYQDMVPSGCETKLYPFTIKKNGNVYGLIFCTSHPLGAEKFINVAWDENDQNGEANFDLDEDEQKSQLYIFGEKRPTKIESFSQRLKALFLAGTFTTNKEAYWMCLQEGMRPSLGKEVIAAMIGAKEIRGSKVFGMSFKTILKENKVVTFTR